LLLTKKREVDCQRRTSKTVRNMRGKTRHRAINKVEDTLTKKIWLHMQSPIEIIGVRKLQRNNLLSVGQSNHSWSLCPHNVKRGDENMRRRAIVLLCKWRRLLLWEGTTDSSLWVAGRLSCNAGLVEGEGEGERCSDVLRLRYQVEKK